MCSKADNSPSPFISASHMSATVPFTNWEVLCGYFTSANIVKIMQNRCRFAETSNLGEDDTFQEKNVTESIY